MDAEALHHHLEAHKCWLATRGAEGKRLNLSGQCLADADLKGAELEHGLFLGTNFEGAQMKSANLRHAVMERCNLTSASLFHAKLNNASLNNAKFLVTDLRQADLRGASLHGTDLRKVLLFTTRLPEKTWLILGDIYDIQITHGLWVKAGCQVHAPAKWRAFSRQEIQEMDGERALSFYPRLLDILDCYLGKGPRPDWVIQ
ncbi:MULTISPECIES: pentapeptide repeat-containing protein [Pantoea]|uniref:pentapeptide repeat-containing protein n=1 Tax=Pantoea TaxID=53335 RepID=UPI00224F0B94|nr:pentapeptide repeat-containing protein [Pantoea vagans]MCX3308262.1 pentapeptide repeat-containing protein [Pantoea vagans]